MKKYYYASGQRIAMRTGAAAPQWLIGDHLGSTSKVANYDGTLFTSQLYKPWGELRYPTTSALPTKFQYTGQYSYSADFGLLYYNARWFDPQLGRFAQADTFVPAGVQGMDRYAAMNNNSVKFTDPSGHDAWWCETAACEAQYSRDPKQLIYEKNQQLAQGVSTGAMSGLDALVALVDYAAALTPDCAKCFVENVGATLTGYGNGNAAGSEMANQARRVAGREPVYDWQYDKGAKFGQSGFADIFKDPGVADSKGNQPQHF